MTLEQAMRASGLLPRDIVADGKWRRCATESKPKRRNGAYILHPDGRAYFKDYAVDLEWNTWRDGSASAQRIDHRAIRESNRQDARRRAQAMCSARNFWQDCRPLNRPHPYIEKKGLSPLGCAGLRTHDGLLVVPVMSGDSLISVQTITADGEKRFWPGAPVKAGAFVMARKPAALTVIVEGLATGLAVYQSLLKASVIVAFDAGNMLRVAERVKPTGSVVVAADNDHKTMARQGVNPGLQHAQNVAGYLGCGMAYPRGIEGTDWCDYLGEVGERAGKKMEREILAAARYVMT